MELIDLEDFIEKNYSLEPLRKIYKNFLSLIINYEGNVKLDTIELSFSLQKAQKKELSKLLAKVFFEKKLFSQLLSLLPEDTIKVFEFLIWENTKFKVNEIEKILKLEDKILLSATKNRPVELNSQYGFFCLEKVNNVGLSSYEYKIYIPSQIRDYIKNFFEPPEEIKLKSVEVLEETDFKNINTSDILKSIHLYFTYINTNKVDLSKEKPSKAVLRNIKEYSELNEFFENTEDKNLEYVKTEIFHNYLKNININPEYNLNDLIKVIFNSFINDDYTLDSLLLHIKGKNILKNNEYFIKKSRDFKKLFLKVFSELPHNQWVSFYNFQKSLYYREAPILIDKETFESNSIYFDELKRNNNYSYTQKTILNEENYNDIFFIPLVKGILFLFSSIGLIDIAYNYPKNSLYIQKNQEYLTIFDELKYIRLNDIGANALGIISNLEYKVDDDIKIELDQDYLIIRTNKQDKIKCAFIETISNKVAENTYLINEKSFISGCNNLEDILNRIKTFYIEINENPGSIWEEFFSSLKSKITSLNKLDDLEILQLPEDDNFLKKISTINNIQKLFYKVEGYKIAVKKDNLDIFIKKLFDEGIFVELKKMKNVKT